VPEEVLDVLQAHPGAIEIASSHVPDGVKADSFSLETRTHCSTVEDLIDRTFGERFFGIGCEDVIGGGSEHAGFGLEAVQSV